MTGSIAASPSAAWSNLFRDGRGLYTALVILGVLLHALQILVIAIIMPSVVADIGGAAYYTWAAMIYTVGSIAGAASLGPVWSGLGRRAGYAAAGVVFLAGTVGCAIAPDMATLIVARAIQGFGGGLIAGGCMALISSLFDEGLRPRILALYQGVWTVSQLCGPVVGGALAELGWWRGSFWVMAPIVLAFIAFAWTKLPEQPAAERRRHASAAVFPVVRLAMLSAGILAIAAAGPVRGLALRVVLLAGGIGLLWLAFRLDRRAPNRLYPARAWSLGAPVGIALWITFLVGIVQTSISVFMPLHLQVVHGVSPVFISFVAIVMSLGWTIGTFSVSGWAGARERTALLIGPPLMVLGTVGIAASAELHMLTVLTASALVLGVGMGTHNVHLIARTMANADKGEERITASAMPSIRSLGTGCGAALAGMLSTMAGLGNATEPAAVADAVTTVYAFQIIPALLTIWLMLRLVRIGVPKA
jgi:MFS family permease